MATIFSLGPAGSDKLCPLKIRVQCRNPHIDVKQTTPIRISKKVWETEEGSNERSKVCRDPKVAKIFDDVNNIRKEIYNKTQEGVALSAKDVKEICNYFFLSAEREKQEAEVAEAARLEAEKKRVTLRKFIDQYRKDVKSGARLTDKGTRYTAGTINGINMACERLKKFEAKKRHVYDFDEIDMTFYRDYTAYLNGLGYSINTTGKCIKAIKAIMAIAESEGLHNNHIYASKKFKGTRVEVDSIYLTKEDLEKIKAVDLKDKGYGFDLARDIFLVGCWTAQRVSDYNNIKPEDIETYVRRTVVDMPIKPGSKKTKPTIVEKEITIINVRQKKTGAKVAIPCSTELKGILEKYNYDIPRLSDQNINDNIKEIARMAGLTEKVSIVTTKGGTPLTEQFEKWQLVHSHTARRTGATLMYLAGMDIYDIMKITGHSTPVMLKKYIKADELEVVDKIMDKYNYFD